MNGFSSPNSSAIATMTSIGRSFVRTRQIAQKRGLLRFGPFGSVALWKTDPRPRNPTGSPRRRAWTP